MTRDAITRRELLRQLAAGALAFGALGALARPTAHAFGDASRTQLATLDYASPGANIRARALDPLLLELGQTTSVATAARAAHVSIDSDALRDFPLLFVTGDRAFPAWSDAQRARLRRYLQAGGMLVFDASEGRTDGPFRQSVERELSAILPDARLTRTPGSHVLYQSFYLCRGDEGRVRTAEHTEVIEQDGRILVLYSHNDLLGAYVRNPSGGNQLSVAGGDARRQYAFRLGVNIVMYALTLDYKQDQVHVPFLLRRRRWRVP